jgi:tRNA(fMet)-specific endonuclease VapC
LALKRLLFDTNAYSAFKQDQPDAVEIVQHATSIVFNSIVLGELLSGFASGTREAQNRQELEEFCSSKRVQRLLVDDRTAEFYARISSDLRQRGRPIPTNDMWIAASAFQHNLAVFTYDPHFQYIDGLSIGRGLEDFLV